ncbi:uncharacterized protein [Physcomitrium patens]|uniref:Smr domain-containing protein n=2 Tax=Physcomitrium patens TaxID=3218 RepID=A0A2K1KM76_PHYPA|nr:pentatricopeptide repeat-containing protein At2g31400, chloroplastic-like isoform X2 [Physcomitrium patens]PNR54890.1 hypothetical protein PHYPA_005783 [Physcomitrium patens]|eukprot:XP_024373717.1 pentatricopeptide repeat-containing protein At2g31400, chloroplastic-like isoform X2 [Physcomitrella patens]
MCWVRGRLPSSSCGSCQAFGTSKGSSHRVSASGVRFGLNRCANQVMTPTAFAEAHLRSFSSKKIDSMAASSPSAMGEFSFFKGITLYVVKKSSRRQGMRCRVVVTNIMIENTGGSRNLGDLKGAEESSAKKPQLELRKPAPTVDPVDTPVTKRVHRVDVPVKVGLNVRPKVQVRPKRISGHSKNVRAKVPRLLTSHREARPRFSNAVACSPEIQSLVAALRKSWRQSRSIDDVMKKHPKPLSPFDITCVLTELQRQHDWRCTLEVFSWSKKQSWYCPNSRLYTRLIGFLGREGRVHNATLLFQEMLLEKCQADQYTYTALVNAYGKAKMFEEALAVFSHMKESNEPNCQPNTVTCNALIDALVKGGLYDQAIQVFFDMRDGTNGLEHGCEPNVITYNVLIDALCKEGLLDIGMKVLQYMRDGNTDQSVQPNSATYNTLINACGKGGLYEKAEELVDLMVEHGVQPDHITYTALIDAYGKAGLWENAENTFKGMKGTNVSVDVMAYTAMIDAYGREGLYQKAEEMFKMMQHSGLRPNQVTYLSLMEAYGKAGLPEESRNVFNIMRESGYEGNVLIYSSLIDAYGKAGNYLEAARMLDMMRRAGCQPNLITYSAILSSCCKSNCWVEAQVLLRRLQVSESEMERTLFMLINGCEINDKLWEDVANMFNGLTRQPKAAQLSFYNSLLDTLWTRGFGERACRVLRHAKEKQVYDDSFYIFSKSEWCLDLHRLSVGGAITMLTVWLGELHHALVWGEDAPESVVIVTGKGSHSKSKSSVLKTPVDLQLAQLCSPFTDVVGNCGRVSASGDDVQNWLLSPCTSQRLRLVDVEYCDNKVVSSRRTS